jgi:hypothetical protein
MFPAIDAYRQKLPPNTFFYSFFLREWNSHIHVAATEAEFKNL